MPYGLTEKDIKLIYEAFKKFPEIEEVILFGSRAMENCKKGSDVDLAVKGTRVTDETITDLRTILNGELPIPYMIDVLDYAGIKNKALVDHISEYGKVFFKGSQTDTLNF